ncbi:MAG TPA: preprotein translocase subunit SecA, partial [Alphaproteobacteria bacterium]|nr:preprotein translocase subunit SecA [Alphaproteobacteria bacterium]
IATNMAGRGTDIQLGGNPEMRIRQELADIEPGAERDAREAAIREEVQKLKTQAIEAGGLYVLATERHESRRIDNQLRGRSGRQGDPGRSKFFLSLQDDLMRIFGSERMDTMLVKLGLKEGEAIVHPWINKALERAQKKVEARNFDIRKNLLKYDDVLNDQRKVIYEQRLELMDAESVTDMIEDMRDEVIQSITPRFMPERAYAEQWDTKGLREEVLKTLNLDLPIEEWAAEEGIAEDEIAGRIREAVDHEMKEKRKRFGDELMDYVERSVLLQTLDHLWRDHIVNLEHLRSVVQFRGYGQRDPLQEYKQEAFELFQALLANLRNTVVSQLMRVELVQNAPPMEELPEMEGHHIDATTGEDDFLEGTPVGGGLFAASNAARNPNDPSSWGDVGRNEPCPCGSGKKFKHCHGAYQTA